MGSSRGASALPLNTNGHAAFSDVLLVVDDGVLDVSVLGAGVSVLGASAFDAPPLVSSLFFAEEPDE